METINLSKKQFVIYMAVAFGLAWILEMIAEKEIIFQRILIPLTALRFVSPLGNFLHQKIQRVFELGRIHRLQHIV